jgi:tetratricopeptide (TPR) repeat protein
MIRGVFLFLLFFFSGVGLASSLDSADRIIKKEISPAYSSYLKGLLSDRYGDSKRALDEYIKAKKFDQESSSLKLRIAVQYIKLENLDKALKILNELKKEEPINLDAYLLLILLYSSKGQEEKANQEYEEMLSDLYKEKPDNLKIAESLAQFKMQKSDYESALNIYENILKLDPNYVEAYFWIGYLYEEKGKRHQAVKSWKKLLELKPD